MVIYNYVKSEHIPLRTTKQPDRIKRITVYQTNIWIIVLHGDFGDIYSHIIYKCGLKN